MQGSNERQVKKLSSQAFDVDSSRLASFRFLTVSFTLPLTLLRIASVFLVQTWFVPDEYWQSLEVAHRSVFGYGYLTWEWKYGIRSYLHPLLFTPCFYLARLIEPYISYDIITLLPRVLQAVITAVSECCFYEFVNTVYSRRIAVWTATSLCVSWFWWYCCSRTLINTLEANLFCFSLYLIRNVLKGDYCTFRFDSTFTLFVVISALTVSLRPTSAAVYFPIYLHLLHKTYLSSNKSYNCLLQLTLKILIVAAIVLATTVAIDCCFYDRWLSVHFNFLKFNVLNGQSGFYGSHPVHWYLSQGIPVVAGVQGLFAAAAVYKYTMNATTKLFLAVVLVTVAAYSIPGHKEFRFIYVLLPVFSLFSGLFLHQLSWKAQKLAVLVLLVTNVPAALYTGLVHQQGPHQVLHSLRSDFTHLSSYADGDDTSTAVMFLLPCHSTPYYHALHHNVTMQFLTCEPNLTGVSDYVDEADVFFSDPLEHIGSYVHVNDRQHCSSSSPRKLVMYDRLYSMLQSKLAGSYDVTSKIFHTYFPEGRVGNYIFILTRKHATVL